MTCDKIIKVLIHGSKVHNWLVFPREKFGHLADIIN